MRGLHTKQNITYFKFQNIRQMTLEDLGSIALSIIIFLLVILRAVKQANSRHKHYCTRCKGSGFIKLGGEELTCNRCAGTGELGNHAYGEQQKSRFK